MARKFIHNVIVEEQDPATDAILEFDLPVNPLSGLLLEIKPLNDTGTLGDYQTLVGILDAFNSIRVLHLGKTILDVRGRDLWAALIHRWGVSVTQNNQVDTTNDRRSIILPILFGRRWGDPTEGLPETRSGELVLRLDVDVASAGYDDLRFQIEALELPGARFSHFTRMTTLAQTFAATGQNDVALPTEWDKRGILVFNTSEFAGATPAPGLGRLSVLVNGVETGYSSTEFEILRGLFGAMGKRPSGFDAHTHRVVDDSANDVQTSDVEDTNEPLDEYAYLDYDFTGDDEYNLVTRGASRVVLRSDAHVAEAMRVIPIEKVSVSDFF